MGRVNTKRLVSRPSKKREKPAKPPSSKVSLKPSFSKLVLTTTFHYDHPSGSDLAYSSSEAGVQGEIWIPRYRFLNSSVPPSDIEVTITIREKR